MKTLKFIIALSLTIGIFSSCQEKVVSTTRYVSLEEYRGFGNTDMSINSKRIRSVIDSMVRNDKDELTADFRTRSYYLQEGNFLWIDRHGVTAQADTLLEYLRTVERMGFSPRRFCVFQIESDINSVRSLGFDAQHSVNVVLGRLEYQLTKAYLRYVTGQRFGYLNPNYIFNRLDTLEPTKPDTLKRAVSYRATSIMHWSKNMRRAKAARNGG